MNAAAADADDVATHLAAALTLTPPPVAGYEDVLQSLHELIAWPRLHSDKAAALGVEWPRGVLLHGPSGCGKSLIVQHAAAVAGALLHTITAATVAGTYVGESEQRLRNAFAQAKHAAASGRPAVVFLDELDTLAPTRSAAGGGPEARLVGQLLTCIDQVALECTPPAHVVIVGATSAPSAVDPALRRPGRLDREILVGVPTRSDRQAMLVAALQRLPGNREDTAAVAVAAAVAGRTAGYTGADLTALVREAALASSGRVDGASLEAAMAVVRPSLARGAAVEVVPVSWDDVGGVDDVRHTLQQAIEWPLQHPEAFARLGVDPPRGVLLYGPPGCSKTTLARALATSTGCPLLPLSASSLYSMYVGEGEALLRARFQQARRTAPSIVFLDEIDALAGKRVAGSGGAGAAVRLLTALLVEMDGLEAAHGVIVLAATNRPWALDAALLRPGRFDVHVYVPPPDHAGRVAVLRVACRRVPLADDVNLEQVASSTHRMTGAELIALVREAAMAALREDVQKAGAVHARHFDAALQELRASVLPEQLEKYSTWGAATRDG